MGSLIKHQHHDDSSIHHGQEVAVTSLYIVWPDLSKILNVCLACPSQMTDMPITAHAYCAPFWKQEVSLSLQLFYHFHEVVVLYLVSCVVLVFLPGRDLHQRAPGCEGPFNAACSFDLISIVTVFLFECNVLCCTNDCRLTDWYLFSVIYIFLGCSLLFEAYFNLNLIFLLFHFLKLLQYTKVYFYIATALLVL